MTTKDNKRVNEWKFYHENGQLERIGNYDANEKHTGEWKFYYKSGQLSGIGNMNTGKQVGEWKGFYEDGNLKLVTNFQTKKKAQLKEYYKSGQLKKNGVISSGKPTGEWKSYHINGTIYQIRLWNEGKLMDIIICQDDKGNKLNKGTLINGNGTVNRYTSEGKLFITETYLNGQKQK